MLTLLCFTHFISDQNISVNAGLTVEKIDFLK